MLKRQSLFVTGTKSHGEEAPPAALTEARVNELVAAGVTAGLKKFTDTTFKTAMDGQAGQLTALLTKIEGMTPTPAAPPPIDPKDKKKDDLPPEVNARLAELEKANKAAAAKLEQLETQRKEAEASARKATKDAKIGEVLNGFVFASPSAREDAAALLESRIVYNESGDLVSSGDAPVPFDTFIKDFIPSQKAHLLAPVGKSGSGASGGGAKVGAGAFTMEQIKPGMSKEDLSRAAGAIKAALSS